jgi:hypothetical protein
LNRSFVEGLLPAFWCDSGEELGQPRQRLRVGVWNSIHDARSVIDIAISIYNVWAFIDFLLAAVEGMVEAAVALADWRPGLRSSTGVNRESRNIFKFTNLTRLDLTRFQGRNAAIAQNGLPR